VDAQYNIHKDVHNALRNVGPVQFTILAGIILLATLIPKGALRLNPKLLDGENLDEEIGDLKKTSSEAGSGKYESSGTPDAADVEHKRRSAEIEMFVPA